MDITPYLYIPFVTWAIAQAIKFSLALVRGEVDLRYLYASGGMPSVHSAVVCSLATWALIDGGPSSALFGVTAVFAAIVMYDSFGVRRSAGEQARTLNNLIADLVKTGNVRDADNYSQLREILGHKPLEVIVGAILGVGVALCFGYQKLSFATDVLVSSPGELKVKLIGGAAAALLVAAIGIYLIVQKRLAHTKTIKTQAFRIMLANIFFALLFGVYAFMAYEQVDMFSPYYILLITALGWVAVLIGMSFNLVRQLKADKPAQNERRDQWLKRAGKKK